MTLDQITELQTLIGLDQAISDAIDAATSIPVGDTIRNDGRAFRTEVRELINEILAQEVGKL